jgi:hypothetical protein
MFLSPIKGGSIFNLFFWGGSRRRRRDRYGAGTSAFLIKMLSSGGGSDTLLHNLGANLVKSARSCRDTGVICQTQPSSPRGR